MVMFNQNDRPMEFNLGIRESDCISFKVLGPACPNSKDNWYRAQLNAEININVGSFQGYQSLVMFTDDIHRFRAALNKLLSKKTIIASLETGDFLSVDVEEKGIAYRVWMQLDSLEQDGAELLLEDGTENWEWRLEMDRISLDALYSAVTRISEHYPTCSVPRN